MYRYAALLLVSACVPHFPNDADHQGVSNKDCVECHVDGDDVQPTDAHFDRDENLTREDCLECHRVDDRDDDRDDRDRDDGDDGDEE